MNEIDRLTEYFKEFPGVGPRQAKRFVYFLLRKNPRYAEELASLIPKIRAQTIMCQTCFRYFTKQGDQQQCNICLSKNRDHTTLMVVTRDSDLEAVEKSGSYNGNYFVLGGVIPLLEEDAQKFIRARELQSIIEKRKAEGLQEVIIALNANADGDNTARHLKKLLEPTGLTLTVLGRGLSTGSELEYADSDTISNALDNRK